MSLRQSRSPAAAGAIDHDAIVKLAQELFGGLEPRPVHRDSAGLRGISFHLFASCNFEWDLTAVDRAPICNNPRNDAQTGGDARVQNVRPEPPER